MCDLCFHTLESVWIWVFNETNCKACRKAACFCVYKTFFFVSLVNSLWPQLLHWTFYLHLCLTSSLQQIFIHLALLQPGLHRASFPHPPTHFSWFPTGPSYHLYLLLLLLFLVVFSHLPLFLITLSLFSLPHPPGLCSWSHAHDSSSHMETFSLWMWGSFYCC